MPLFPSDFKKFKYVSSDKDSTTLKHEKGHELKIAHKALSPNMRTQLEAIALPKGNLNKLDGIAKEATLPDQRPVREAEGGVIESADRSGALGTQRKVAQEQKDTVVHAASAPRYTDGKDVRTPEQKAKAEVYERTGGLQGYAEGGDVAEQEVPAADVPADPTPQGDQPQAIDPAIGRQREIYNNLIKSNTVVPNNEMPGPPEQKMFGAQGEAPQAFSPQNWSVAENMYQREKAENAAQTAAAQQKVIQENVARVAAGLAPAPVPNVPEGPQIPGSPENPAAAMAPNVNPTGEPPKQSQPDTMAQGMSDAQGMLGSGMKEYLAGLQGTAKQQGLLGDQNAQILARQETAKTDARAAYQKQYNELETERQDLMKDINDGHIDPNKFWTGDANGNGGHSRIAAGIGIILAGFNPTNNPNAAIQFLQKQMDMNLEAQKANLGSKQNLLAANMRQFGNLKDATEMTKIMQNDIMQNELMQAAAKAQSPLAKNAAMQAAGQFKMENAMRFQQFANMRAIMSLSQNGAAPGAIEHALGYLRATNPEMAKEMESRYIPHVGMATIPVPAEIRDKITAHENMASNIRDLQKFVDTHSTIVPGTPDYNVGQQKALVLQSAIRENALGTVYKESEQKLLDQFVNNNPAGAMKMLKTVPQLKELLKSNERANNVLKRNYGLPTSTPEPEIKVIGDVKYMRGPDGKAVKVK